MRQVVVEPTVALEEEYDALVVSDRWPALTARFVDAVRHDGRRILGVFDPEEPAGKDHLVALAVDATIASDAPMTDFVDALADLGPLPQPASPRPRRRTRRRQRRGARGPSSSWSRGRAAVGSPRSPSGWPRRSRPVARSVVLVDAHEHHASVAGRLGLAVEPNLRSAIDAHQYGFGDLDGSVVSPRQAGFGVVTGFPGPVAAAQVTASDVVEVVGVLGQRHDVVVVDADDSSSTTRALVAESTAIVGVAAASPVGIVRTLAWGVDLRELARATPLHLAVNRAPGARYRREEIRTEVVRTLPPASLTWVPSDAAVDRAAWDGCLPGRGPFRRAMEELAAIVGDPGGASRERRRRSRREPRPR